MKKFVLLAFLYIGSRIVCAQIEVIEIDTLTHVPKKALPFDRPFVLQLYVPGDVVAVTYLKQYDRENFAATVKQGIKKGGGTFDKFNRLPENDIENKKIGNKDIALLHFNFPNLLKPNQNYIFIISYGKVNTNINSFFRKFYDYAKADTIRDQLNADKFLNEAKKYHTDFKIEYKKIFNDVDYLVPSDTYFNALANINSFKTAIKAPQGNNKSLYDLYSTYDSDLAVIKSLVASNTTALASPWNSFIKNLSILKEDIGRTDIQPGNKTFDYHARDSYKVLNVLLDVSFYKLEDILKGSIALGCLNCEKIGNDIDSKTEKRVTNMNTTITLLSEIRRSLNILNTIKIPERTTTITALNTLIDSLVVVHNSYKGLVKNETAIQEAILIRNFAGFRYYTSIILNGASHILNLETRSKNVITPDFGMAFPNLIQKNTSYGLLPYLGFHINFSPIDRDAVYRSYKKSLAQQLSLSVGVSMVSIKDSTTQIRKLNFFEKGSLLTGIGYRLSEIIRIVGGYQWYFEVPVSNVAVEKKFKGYPYLGVSVDLSIKSLLNGLGDILPGIGKTRETIAPVTTKAIEP